MALRPAEILDKRNWIFFKLYKDPSSPSDWKANLDWYHQTLVTAVKPHVLCNTHIEVVFFGFYGPQVYCPEGEKYEKQIAAPRSNVVFIRLRILAQRGHKRQIKRVLSHIFRTSRNLVWDYETMVTYDVSGDLGTRYGNVNNVQTIEFIRYWNAACRYILSILSIPGNWTQGIDVWGIPHLVNNSIGAWLRPERNPVLCPHCQTHMYMRTSLTSVALRQAIGTQIQTPYFLFDCPNCLNQIIIAHNI